MPVCFRWVYEQEERIVSDYWRRKAAAQQKEPKKGGMSVAQTAKASHGNNNNGDGDDDDDGKGKIRRIEPITKSGLLLAVHREYAAGDPAAFSERQLPGGSERGGGNDDKGAKDSNLRKDTESQAKREALQDTLMTYCGSVPLGSVAAAPFPLCRATGVDYLSPSTEEATPAAVRGSSSGGGEGEGGEGGTERSSKEALNSFQDDIPCGEAFYYALRFHWRRQAPPGSAAAAEVALLPPLPDEEDLDDSLIMDCVCDDYKGVLDPPVPLSYIVDCLVPEWEDEGLFEITRKREAQAQAQAQMQMQQSSHATDAAASRS